MILPMHRVRIAGSKGVSKDLVQHLHHFGSFHITPPSSDPLLKDSGLSMGVFSQEITDKLSEFESLLSDIQAALALLPEPDFQRDQSPPFPLPANLDHSEESLEKIRSAAEKIMTTSKSRDSSRGELKEVVRFRKMFEDFLPLIQMVASSTRVELTGLRFQKDFENACHDLEKLMDEVTDGAFSLFKSADGEMSGSVLVVYPVSLQDEVMRRVIGQKARPVHLPERYSGKTYASTLKRLFERERELQAELNQLNGELAKLSQKWREVFLATIEEVERTAAPLRTQHLLSHTENAFWLSGWVPEMECESLKKSVNEKFQDSALVYLLPPSPKEFAETPVKLKNASWASPFERFLNIFALPQYGTVDPTIIMAVTFPLFFGLILGDIGYALMLAGISFFLKRRWPENEIIKDVAFVINVCAISSAVFGLIYGELFGKLWDAAGLPHPLFHRKEKTLETLYLVLLLGCGHIVFGTIVGAVNGMKSGSLHTAIEKFSDAGLLLSMVWIAFWVGSGHEAGWRMAVPTSFFIIKLFAGKIFETIMELPKLVANVLSYSRLMALGLASIIVADLADDILFSGIWPVLAVTAAILAHTVAFVIGVFSPAIQAGRLHFVEFFSQFYVPKGVAFEPLKRV